MSQSEPNKGDGPSSKQGPPGMQHPTMHPPPMYPYGYPYPYPPMPYYPHPYPPPFYPHPHQMQPPPLTVPPGATETKPTTTDSLQQKLKEAKEAQKEKEKKEEEEETPMDVSKTPPPEGSVEQYKMLQRQAEAAAKPRINTVPTIRRGEVYPANAHKEFLNQWVYLVSTEANKGQTNFPKWLDFLYSKATLPEKKLFNIPPINTTFMYCTLTVHSVPQSLAVGHGYGLGTEVASNAAAKDIMEQFVKLGIIRPHVVSELMRVSFDKAVFADELKMATEILVTIIKKMRNENWSVEYKEKNVDKAVVVQMEALITETRNKVYAKAEPRLQRIRPIPGPIEVPQVQPIQSFSEPKRVPINPERFGGPQTTATPRQNRFDGPPPDTEMSMKLMEEKLMRDMEEKKRQMEENLRKQFEEEKASLRKQLAQEFMQVSTPQRAPIPEPQRVSIPTSIQLKPFDPSFSYIRNSPPRSAQSSSNPFNGNHTPSGGMTTSEFMNRQSGFQQSQNRFPEPVKVPIRENQESTMDRLQAKVAELEECIVQMQAANMTDTIDSLVFQSPAFKAIQSFGDTLQDMDDSRMNSVIFDLNSLITECKERVNPTFRKRRIEPTAPRVQIPEPTLVEPLTGQRDERALRNDRRSHDHRGNQYNHNDDRSSRDYGSSSRRRSRSPRYGRRSRSPDEYRGSRHERRYRNSRYSVSPERPPTKTDSVKRINVGHLVLRTLTKDERAAVKNGTSLAVQDVKTSEWKVGTVQKVSEGKVVLIVGQHTWRKTFEDVYVEDTKPE